MLNMNEIINLWNQFINLFPIGIRSLIALGIFIGLVVLILDLIKRNFLWIILLVIFIPASIPIFKTIVDGIFYLLRNVLP